jgi:hypothetical protein
MMLDLEKLAAHGHRYEFFVNHDGQFVVHFFDKHGSLVDILPVEDFILPEVDRG